LQSLAVQGFWPLEADTQRPNSYSGELGLGIERTFTRDGVSFNTRGLAMQSSQVSFQGVEVSPQYRTYVAEGDLGWRHSFSPVWSDYISGGGMIVKSSGGSSARFEPAGLAELSARKETNEVSLRVERTATPSVLAGNIFLSTRAIINASAGFGRTQKLQLRSAASFDRASAIGATGENQGGASVWLAQIVMTYGVPGPILLSLEYSFTDQRGDPPTSSGAPAFSSFRRNLVMLGIEVKYASLRPLAGGAQRIRGAGNPAEDPRQ
jgi:hypothetical protein